MTVPKTRRNSIACLLLILFVGLWASSNLFVHSHIVNLQLVTHSHPFSHKTAHSHSGAELNLLAALAHLTFIAGGLSLLALPAVQKTKRIDGFIPHHLTSFCATYHCLRAPPVC